jgi:predicted SprT family Zn-dependent metalloprotease
MTHAEAQQLALDLMHQHGLLQAGWQFRWNNGKRQLGVCRVRRNRLPRSADFTEVKTIGLSRHLVALNSDEEVRDTILHEIAHAIAGVKNGHNHLWKETCRKIGARPRRLAGEGVKVVQAPYIIVCDCCQRSLGKRHRRVSARKLARSYCRSCGPQSMGKLRLTNSESMPASAIALN